MRRQAMQSAIDGQPLLRLDRDLEIRRRDHFLLPSKVHSRQRRFEERGPQQRAIVVRLDLDLEDHRRESAGVTDWFALGELLPGKMQGDEVGVQRERRRYVETDCLADGPIGFERFLGQCETAGNHMPASRKAGILETCEYLTGVLFVQVDEARYGLGKVALRFEDALEFLAPPDHEGSAGAVFPKLHAVRQIRYELRVVSDPRIESLAEGRIVSALGGVGRRLQVLR